MCHLLLAASSSSWGLLVAPTTSTLSSPWMFVVNLLYALNLYLLPDCLHRLVVPRTQSWFSCWTRGLNRTWGKAKVVIHKRPSTMIPPCREQGINLIDEYHTWLMHFGDCKQRPHHLLSLPHLLVCMQESMKCWKLNWNPPTSKSMKRLI